MRYGPIYHDCVRIQKRLMNLMMNPKATPNQVAALTSAWDRMEDRKRILKGRGEPKPVESVPVVKPAMVAQTFIAEA